MLITLHYFAMSDTPGDFLRASVSSGDVLWRQKRRHINDKRHTNVFDDMCLTMFNVRNPYRKIKNEQELTNNTFFLTGTVIYWH